jgi:putative exosortase-associated protein (TIGR04073 family)
MKTLAALLLSVAVVASASADIQKPPRKGPTYKFSSGIAKVAFSAGYIADSFYDETRTHGGTVGFSYGLVKGASKCVAGTVLGAAEVVTAPLPPYRNIHPDYTYPPADLKRFW